ncbi:MAG TPA: CheR family methyltransferase [Rudaea sp.]
MNRLLHALPSPTGMAFVIVQHLDPVHESMLPEILGRATSMPVSTAEDHEPVQADRVYVIPPGKNMVIGDGRLQLSPRTETRGQHRSIDLFFRSLAEQQAHRAIGVILSGSSSDGTLGLEEIKAAGGITFAQDDTAEHTRMPRSAIAAGCIDFVLAPADIAVELGRIGRHPYITPDPDELPIARDARLFGRILEILREATSVDFSNYKRNTLERRITRRMLLRRLDGLEDYLRCLQETPNEVEALYQDVLISVTSFFRDPEAYEIIKNTVFPRLIEKKSRHDQVRVWALGCSTGEEAYSIAMAYTEYAETSGRRVPLQIFATDLNGAGIQKARTGVYPKGIAQDLSPERLRRFFVEVDGSYRIAKPIRDMCVFAQQNVLADPPFSRMDLIACRNMLIYLDSSLQQKLLPILHYSLQPVGFLWLGTSETIGSFRELFDVQDARNKVYVKKAGTARASIRIPHRVVVPALPRIERPSEVLFGAVNDPQREADRILLARHAPPGVVINTELEIIQFRGDTSPYLTPAPGRATLNLLKMLREGLIMAVRAAAHRAMAERSTVHQQGLRVKTESGYRDAEITITPLKGTAEDGFLLVTFGPAGNAAIAGQGVSETTPPPVSDEDNPQELGRLRQELDSTRDYLQSMIEGQEATNEELLSANEEVQSANEELQSINEELETSKEEIQSSNEELATVNDELQKINLELSQSNDDLLNLLASVQMPIVMLGRDLRIRRFTPAAEKTLKLIPTDVGRPIGDIKLDLNIVDLAPMIADVVDSVRVREQLVEDKLGHSYLLRMHPYRTLDNNVDGAVMVLVDVDQLKRAQHALDESEERFSELADSAPVLIWINGTEGKRHINKAYMEFVGAHESTLQGNEWANFIHPEDRETYFSTFSRQSERHEPFEGQFRLRRADGEYRWMKTLGMPRTIGGRFVGYIGYKVDITELKEAEESLRETDRSKDNFLAMLAHELRTPLAAMRNAVQIIGHERGNADLHLRAKSVIERQTVQMVRIVDDLLDLSRLTRGTLHLRKQRIDLLGVLRQAIDATAYHRDTQAQQLSLSVPEDPLFLDADEARLQQVFANLLSNAARYSPQHGHVWITVEREGAAQSREPSASDSRANDRVVVRVRDDGIGIARQMQTVLFNLFSQAKTDGHHGTGLGIGLNLSKHLVELHGGSIDVFSEGPGHGSEFVVRLPTSPMTDEAHETAAPEKSQLIAHKRRLRVLVVDDDADAAQMLCNLFELEGQDVRCANDGANALRIAREFHPHLALLDISMPVMDGRELARQLRTDPDTTDTFLVAVTGFSPNDAVLDMSPEGFDERVTKPFEKDALNSLLTRVDGAQA